MYIPVATQKKFTKKLSELEWLLSFQPKTLCVFLLSRQKFDHYLSVISLISIGYDSGNTPKVYFIAARPQLRSNLAKFEGIRQKSKFDVYYMIFVSAFPTMHDWLRFFFLLCVNAWFNSVEVSSPHSMSFYYQSTKRV